MQQETTGHRGRSGDPLYGIRKLLLCARHRLDDTALARIEAALAAGDPYEEVGCVHYGKELLAAVSAAGDIFAARLELERFFEWAAEVDVPDPPGHHHRRLACRGAGLLPHWRRLVRPRRSGQRRA